MYYNFFFCVTFSLTLLIPYPVIASDISNDRQQELIHLIQHDCGSCHGMTLKGGLGTPLTVENLQNKSNEALISIIMNGVKGTPMPPWKDVLAEQEVVWMVKQLKTGLAENH
ncbi:MAG: cytochrome c [Proteobacteria bacterium]|nr:cytochrome c [Pseudomonadota bacterium]NOG61548.1 cytochrome c [Pseudomonadota bacterium]